MGVMGFKVMKMGLMSLGSYKLLLRYKGVWHTFLDLDTKTCNSLPIFTGDMYNPSTIDKFRAKWELWALGVMGLGSYGPFLQIKKKILLGAIGLFEKGKQNSFGSIDPWENLALGVMGLF